MALALPSDTPAELQRLDNRPLAPHFHTLGSSGTWKSFATSEPFTGPQSLHEEDEAHLNKGGEASALLDSAQKHLGACAAAEALAGAEQALSLLARNADETRSRLEAWRIMANAHLLQGDPMSALRIALDGQRACSRNGDTDGEARMLLAVAEAHLQQEEVEPALRAAQEAQEVFAKLEDAVMEGKSWTLLSQIHSSAKELQDALDAASQAVELFAGAADRSAEAEAWARLAVAYWKNGDRSEAREAGEEAMVAFREVNDTRGEVGVLCDAAEALLKQGRASQALQHANQALELCSTSPSTAPCEREKVQALCLATHAHFARGQADEALDLAEETVANLQKECPGNRLALAEAQNVLMQVTQTAAGLLGLSSLSKKALACATEAVAASRGISHDRLTVGALHGLAKAQLNLRDASGAQASLEEALQLSRQCEYMSGEASALYTLSEVQLFHGQAESALRSCSEAQVLFDTIGDKGMLAEALLQSASVYCTTGSFQEALANVKEARQIKEDAGDKKGGCGVLLMAAELFARNGAKELALKTATEAWEALNCTSEWMMQMDALRTLGSAHIAKEEPEEALNVAQKGQERFRRVSNQLGQARMSLLAAQARFNIFAAAVEGGKSSNRMPVSSLYSEAGETAAEAVSLARAAGDRPSLADALYLQSQVLGICDDTATLEAGRKVARECAAVNRRCGRRHEEALAVVIEAEICDRLGSRFAAKEAALKAQAIYESTGPSVSRQMANEREQGLAVCARFFMEKSTEASSEVAPPNVKVAEGPGEGVPASADMPVTVQPVPS